MQRRSTTPRRGSHPVPPSYTTYRDEPTTQGADGAFASGPPGFDAIPTVNGGDRSASRPLALRNWRVRTRLVALILVPTVAAVVLAGLRVASSLRNAEGYARTLQLTEIDLWAVDLILALQDERDEMGRYIVDNRPEDTALVQQRTDTVDGLRDDFQAEVDVFNETFESDEINAQLSRVQAGLDGLDELRTAGLTTAAPASSLFNAYTEIIDDLLDFNGQIGQGSPDREITQSVEALDALARTEEFAARQRGLIFRAILAGAFAPAELDALHDQEAQRQAAFADFQRTATPQQLALYDELVVGRMADDAAVAKAQFIALGEAGQPLGSDVDAEIWNATAKGELDLLRAVERRLIDDLNERSRELQDQAQRGALLDTLVVALVLFLAFLGISLMGRSMTRPLRRLQTSAFEVAETRLPEIVRQLEQSDGRTTDIEIEPVGVASRDEIGDVARAFDAVHAQAVRLAIEQAELRSNVNAMFVNLSRRSQGLVERQLRLIEDLENSEQDPDQLGNLFRLDHLATRMRRNGENLLVLAGEEPERRWSQPVPLVDIVRAGISEVEQYERVELTPLPDVEVAGRAVNDVVHLLAELLENATVFSSGETRVLVTGHVLGSGGVMLEVEDRGIGMESGELDSINERLTNPPVIDVSVSRRMGLFVVGRLSHRHGIRVRLRAGQHGGVAAHVALPPDLVTFTSGALPIGIAGLQPGLPAPPDGFGVTSSTGLPQRPRAEIPASAQNGVGAGMPPDDWPSRPMPGPLSPLSPLPPVPTPSGPPVPPFVGRSLTGSVLPYEPAGADGSAEEEADDDRVERPLSGGLQAPWSGPIRRIPQPDADISRPDAPQTPESGAVPQVPTAGTVSGPVPQIPGPPSGGLPRIIPAPPVPDKDFPTPLRPAGGTGGLPLPVQPPVRPLPQQPLTAAQRARASAGAPPSGDVLDPTAAASRADRQAEPIFASVQSEWFRRRTTPAAPATPLGGMEVGSAVPPAGAQPPSDAGLTASREAPSTEPPSAAPQQAPSPSATPPTPLSGLYVSAVQSGSVPPPADEESWTSPGDQGWRAAAAVTTPAVGGYTSGGLPRRVPKTNLVPGSADPMPGSLSGQGRHAQRSADEVRGRLSSFHRGTRRGREEGQQDAAETTASQTDGQE